MRIYKTQTQYGPDAATTFLANRDEVCYLCSRVYRHWGNPEELLPTRLYFKFCTTCGMWTCDGCLNKYECVDCCEID